MEITAWEKVHVLKVGNRMVAFFKASGCYAWVIDSGLSTGHPSIEDAVGSALRWLRRTKPRPVTQLRHFDTGAPVAPVLNRYTMLPYDSGNTGNRTSTVRVSRKSQ